MHSVSLSWLTATNSNGAVVNIISNTSRCYSLNPCFENGPLNKAALQGPNNREASQKTSIGRSAPFSSPLSPPLLARCKRVGGENGDLLSLLSLSLWHVFVSSRQVWSLRGKAGRSRVPWPSRPLRRTSATSANTTTSTASMYDSLQQSPAVDSWWLEGWMSDTTWHILCHI